MLVKLSRARVVMVINVGQWIRRQEFKSRTRMFEFLYCTNAVGNGLNSIIFLLALGKY